MNTLTLTDYIQEKRNSDQEFNALYVKEEIINHIAQMITDARKKAKLTQAELAEKIGTTQSVVSRIERGGSAFVPSLDTLIRIASALDMTLQIRLQ